VDRRGTARLWRLAERVNAARPRARGQGIPSQALAHPPAALFYDPMSLIENERTKLLATALNTAATSCFTVGIATPLAGSYTT
jgi:hypothetical protein